MCRVDLDASSRLSGARESFVDGLADLPSSRPGKPVQQRCTEPLVRSLAEEEPGQRGSRDGEDEDAEQKCATQATSAVLRVEHEGRK